MIGEALDGQRAGEILREQPERLRVLEVAQRVHLPLGVARVAREQARELGAPRAPIGLRQQHARIEQLVEQDRLARQVVGRPLRCAHQLRESRQHRRMLDQEREIGAAPAHRLEELEQPLEHRLRVGAAFLLRRRDLRAAAAPAHRRAAARAPAAARSVARADAHRGRARSPAGSAKPAAPRTSLRRLGVDTSPRHSAANASSVGVASRRHRCVGGRRGAASPRRAAPNRLANCSETAARCASSASSNDSTSAKPDRLRRARRVPRPPTAASASAGRRGTAADARHCAGTRTRRATPRLPRRGQKAALLDRRRAPAAFRGRAARARARRARAAAPARRTRSRECRPARA